MKGRSSEGKWFFRMMGMGVLLLSILVFGGGLHAQNTEKDDALAYQDVQIKTTDDQQPYIEITLSTTLPSGARIRVALKNSVEMTLVEQKSVTVTGSGPQIVRFGPYDLLWDSTYRLETTFDPGHRKNRQLSSDVRRMPSRPILIQTQRVIGESVLPPEFQQFQFAEEEHAIYRNFRSLFLSFYPSLRTLRHKRKQQGLSDALRQQFEQLRAQNNKRLRTLKDRVETLREAHGTGSPYRKEIRELVQMYQWMDDFMKTALTSLKQDWKTSADDRKRTKEERFASGNASSEDHRIRLLNRLVPRLSDSHRPRPLIDEFLRVQRTILMRLQRFLAAMRKNGETDPVDWDQKIQTLKNLIGRKISDLNERLWLFRGTAFQDQEGSALFQKAVTLKRQFMNIRSLLSDLPVQRTQFENIGDVSRLPNEKDRKKISKGMKKLTSLYLTIYNHYLQDLLYILPYFSPYMERLTDAIGVDQDHLAKYRHPLKQQEVMEATVIPSVKTWKNLSETQKTFLQNYPDDVLPAFIQTLTEEGGDAGTGKQLLEQHQEVRQTVKQLFYFFSIIQDRYREFFKQLRRGGNEKGTIHSILQRIQQQIVPVMKGVHQKLQPLEHAHPYK